MNFRVRAPAEYPIGESVPRDPSTGGRESDRVVHYTEFVPGIGFRSYKA